MRKTALSICALVLCTLHNAGCTTEQQIVGGATTVGGLSPGQEIQQSFYLGVFDPHGQIPTSLYRITVHGQASILSSVKFASGWLPAHYVDSLTTEIGFGSDMKHLRVTDSQQRALLEDLLAKEAALERARKDLEKKDQEIGEARARIEEEEKRKEKLRKAITEALRAGLYSKFTNNGLDKLETDARNFLDQEASSNSDLLDQAREEAAKLYADAIQGFLEKNDVITDAITDELKAAGAGERSLAKEDKRLALRNALRYALHPGQLQAGLSHAEWSDLIKAEKLSDELEKEAARAMQGLMNSGDRGNGQDGPTPKALATQAVAGLESAVETAALEESLDALDGALRGLREPGTEPVEIEAKLEEEGAGLDALRKEREKLLSLVRRRESVAEAAKILADRDEEDMGTTLAERTFLLFGPEGVRKAPKNHRLVIVMASSPEEYFGAVGESMTAVTRVRLQQINAKLNRLLFRTLLALDAELSRLAEIEARVNRELPEPTTKGGE